MRGRIFGLSALALVGALHSTSAEAQSTGEYAPTHRSRAALDFGLYHREVSRGLALTILSPDLRVAVDALEVADGVGLVFDGALHTVGYITHAEIFGRAQDNAEYRVANLYLGARASLTPVEHLRVRAGLGLVAPILNAYNDDDAAQPAAALSLLPTGAWDSWLSLRGYLPIVLRADAEYREELFFVGGEIGLGFSPGVLEHVDDTQIGAQFAAFGGVRLIPEFAFGLRLQGVVVDSTGSHGTDPDPIGYVSLVPFARGEFDPLFVEARFFVGLADNDVYRSIGEKSWSLNLQLGADFDVY